MSAETVKSEFDDNFVLPFQIGDSAVRGRIVRFGSEIHDIMTRHAHMPEPVNMMLGEAAALISMLGNALKFDGKVIMQMSGNGPVSMLVADYSNQRDVAYGGIRVMAKIAEGKEEEAAKARGPELHFLLRTGNMVMTIDQGSDMERYQGVVKLDGKDLATGVENYFKQSEQIPTAIILAVGKLQVAGMEEPQWRAGGIMIQHVPGEGGKRERGEAVLREEESREIWDNAEALLRTTKADELLDPMLTAEELIYRLYHENGATVYEPKPVQHHCPCSKERIANVLSQYQREDLDEMAKDGVITVTCEFCRTDYTFDVAQTAAD